MRLLMSLMLTMGCLCFFASAQAVECAPTSANFLANMEVAAVGDMPYDVEEPDGSKMPTPYYSESYEPDNTAGGGTWYVASPPYVVSRAGCEASSVISFVAFKQPDDEAVPDKTTDPSGFKAAQLAAIATANHLLATKTATPEQETIFNTAKDKSINELKFFVGCKKNEEDPEDPNACPNNEKIYFDIAFYGGGFSDGKAHDSMNNFDIDDTHSVFMADVSPGKSAQSSIAHYLHQLAQQDK